MLYELIADTDRVVDFFAHATIEREEEDETRFVFLRRDSDPGPCDDSRYSERLAHGFELLGLTDV